MRGSSVFASKLLAHKFAYMRLIGLRIVSTGQQCQPQTTIHGIIAEVDGACVATIPCHGFIQHQLGVNTDLFPGLNEAYSML